MATVAKVTSKPFEPPLGTTGKIILPRSTHRFLINLTNKNEPKAMRRFFKTWTDERKAIKPEWIQYSIDHNAAIHPAFQKMLYTDVKSWFLPDGIIETEWSKAAALGTSLMIRGIEKFSGEPLGTSPIELKIIEGWNPAFVEDFPELAASMTEIFTVRADVLTSRMSRANITAINKTLQRTIIEEGLGVRGVSEAVENSIGLTVKQEYALANYNARLIEAGVTKAKRWKALKTYSRRANVYRARNIARTEMAYAYNGAMDETVTDAIRKGYVSPTIAKVWETASDERVCPYCGELHGTPVGFKDSFEVEKGATDYSATFPPLHASCRCILIYEVFG